MAQHDKLPGLDSGARRGAGKAQAADPRRDGRRGPHVLERDMGAREADPGELARARGAAVAGDHEIGDMQIGQGPPAAGRLGRTVRAGPGTAVLGHGVRHIHGTVEVSRFFNHDGPAVSRELPQRLELAPAHPVHEIFDPGDTVRFIVCRTVSVAERHQRTGGRHRFHLPAPPHEPHGRLWPFLLERDGQPG